MILTREQIEGLLKAAEALAATGASATHIVELIRASTHRSPAAHSKTPMTDAVGVILGYTKSDDERIINLVGLCRSFEAALSGAHKIIGPWSHETEPHCIGCWVIDTDEQGPFAKCNECGERRDILPLLDSAIPRAPADGGVVVPEEDEKTATLVMHLAADSGFVSDSNHRISPNQWGQIHQVIEGALSAAPASRDERMPTVDECFAAGKGPEATDKFREGGLPNTPEERARFEAYMRGHCWDFGSYDSVRECYDAVYVRMLYGVWRDRGMLATSAPVSGWRPIVSAPNRRLVLVRGDSGYSTHRTFVMSAVRDPQYRPRSPWLDVTGTCLEDYGFVPTEWCEIDSLLPQAPADAVND